MRRFGLNDKVMQTKNNYELMWSNLQTGEMGKGVFNGDIGKVHSFNDGKLNIVFSQDRFVSYDMEASNDLMLAYAMTIHKSQGNEFDYCVIPIYNVPYLLKYRKLIYTGITRAKKHVTIIGSRWEFEEMIRNLGFNDRKQIYAAKYQNYFVINYSCDVIIIG